MTKNRTVVPIRITLLNPPAGVQYCLENRRHELSQKVMHRGGDLSFDLAVEVDPKAVFHGEFAMGTPDKRFVYICSGTCAGQIGTCWTRRAKVNLSGISTALIAEALARNARLEARFVGTAKDGGPSCATVPLVDGWTVVG